MTTERLLETQALADLLEVPTTVVYDWRRRGKLTPAGMLPGRGRTGHVPLYRPSEARELAQAWHARRQRTRGHQDQPGAPG